MIPVEAVSKHTTTTSIERNTDGQVDCRSILCKCFDQESPESKNENVVLCFLHTLGHEPPPANPAWSAT